MRKISIETLKQILARRKSGEYLDMWEIELSEADLSGWNLAEIDFSLSQLWSLVDENFVYRKGQWVEVPDFDEDRWNDSTTGIHFWMTREEAKAY